MAWGNRNRARLDALVVDAPPPWNTGSRRAEVTLVVRPPGAGPVSVRAKMRVTKESWLVRGMTVPVEFDPSDPGDVDIVADAIAPLSERLAAADPALVDPVAAVRAARQAIEDAIDAAAASQDPTSAGRAREMRQQMRAVDEAERDAKLEAAEREYSSGSPTAPDGRLRGYGRLVSRTSPRPDGPDRSQPDWFTDAIYSVQLIGFGPYAILKRYDRRDRRQGSERYDLDGAGIVPVLVSPDDREDVEILWDEVPKYAREMFDAAMGEVDSARRQAAPVVAGMYDQMFAMIPDPTMRAVLADQIRAQGYDLPEHLAGGGAGPPAADARRAKLDALRESGVLTQAEYDDQVARLGD